MTSGAFQSDDLAAANAWWRAVESVEVTGPLQTVHDEVARETERRRPRCDLSGRCCRFEEFGHRLYVTGLEAAWSLSRIVPALAEHEIDVAVARGDCPFLVSGRCSVHAARPMGCRVFYCDATAVLWQRELHERCHASILALHDRLRLPYRYAEWRAILKLCVAARPRGTEPTCLDIVNRADPGLLQVRVR